MIPQHISKFLHEYIKSIWAIDLLRLLARAPTQAWSAQELTAELRASVPLVEMILKDFLHSGLIKETEAGRFHYAADASLNALVTEMLKYYAERPVAVIGEIASSPTDKIQSFVDAFRIKKG